MSVFNDIACNAGYMHNTEENRQLAQQLWKEYIQVQFKIYENEHKDRSNMEQIIKDSV